MPSVEPILTIVLQNASKFAKTLEWKNPHMYHLVFSIFISRYVLCFFPKEGRYATTYVDNKYSSKNLIRFWKHSYKMSSGTGLIIKKNAPGVMPKFAQEIKKAGALSCG